MRDGAYRRSVRLPHGDGVLELRPAEGHVSARFWLESPRDLAAAMQRCRALLDLDSDPAAVADALGGDALLGRLVRACPGRRVVGHVDSDELAVRAVLGQQVSLAGAATLAGRLVRAYGRPLANPVGTLTHTFPSARALASGDPARIAMPKTRVRALRALATALAGGELVLDQGADRERARERLMAIPGIGPWTTEYVAMRALRDPDAFPVADLGIRHALERLGRDGGGASAARVADPLAAVPRVCRAAPVGDARGAAGERARAGGVGLVSSLATTRTGTTGLLYTTLASPIGELLLLGDGSSLRGLYMQDGRKPMALANGWEPAADAFADVSAQLAEYFAGERTSFDVKVTMDGTAFQRRVWRSLQDIEYGETVSYGELARRVGSPAAARAAGMANGRNPISVIVPCHRVIGAKGTLTGYGGGIERKRLLLELEAGHPPLALAASSGHRRTLRTGPARVAPRS